MSEFLDYEALKEPDKKRAIGPECAVELKEGEPDGVGLVVNEGVPGENPASGTV
jgi:hypothetical protein